MSDSFPKSCTAFAGTRQIATGTLAMVALKAQSAANSGDLVPVSIFDDVTGRVVEIDLRGTVEDLMQRIAINETSVAPPHEPTTVEEGVRRPGRPKLGVVAREVTLLPRHWEWLAIQPGGASVALRKLVEEARRTHQGRDRRRIAQEAAYRFVSAMAGNEPDFEEALRALFAGNRQRFAELVEAWPVDLGDYAKKLAAAAFLEPESGGTSQLE